MYAQTVYKQAIITNEANNIAASFQTHKNVSDEIIYLAMKNVEKLLDPGRYSYRIDFVQKDIIDHAPEKPVVTDKEEYTDQVLVLKANQFTIENVELTNEAVYGENFDGKNRSARLLWVDNGGVEHFVQLDGFDVDIVETPNGPFSYNSDEQTITFTSMKAYDINYILRRYKHE